MFVPILVDLSLFFFCHSYILDGYPVTARQIQFLTERSIIPYKVVELSIGSGSVFVRAERDRISPSRYHAFLVEFRLSCNLPSFKSKFNKLDLHGLPTSRPPCQLSVVKLSLFLTSILQCFRWWYSVSLLHFLSPPNVC